MPPLAFSEMAEPPVLTALTWRTTALTVSVASSDRLMLSAGALLAVTRPVPSTTMVWVSGIGGGAPVKASGEPSADSSSRRLMVTSPGLLMVRACRR